MKAVNPALPGRLMARQQRARLPRYIGTMRILGLLMFCCFACSAQTIEDGVKGILPLVSTKGDVERVFGKGRPDSDGFYFFHTAEGFLRFNFSTHRCEDVPFGRGGYDVPPGTVLFYTYNPNEAKPLSSIRYNKEQYYEDRSGSAKGGFTLISKDNSIRIEVQEQITPDKVERFYLGVLYRLSTERRKSLKCKSHP